MYRKSLASIITILIQSACLCLMAFTSLYAQNDVRTGMKINDALLIAKRSVTAASGYTDPLKPEHTLKFVGIADQQHLDTLRRYVIINVEIGVQSLWAVDGNVRLAQHYIIPKSALAKMDHTWTLEKLAVEISKNAGLAKLPLSKAAKIVADCRYFATGSNIERRVFIDSIGTTVAKKPPAPSPTPSPTPATIRIRDELTSNSDRDDFINCIVGKEDVGGLDTSVIGVPSAKVITPKSDVFPYQIAREVFEDGVNTTWSYQKLIVFVARYAEAPLSPDLTSAQLVVSALLEMIPSRETNKSASLEMRESVPKSPGMVDPCSYNSSLITFRLAEKLPGKINEDSSLDDLGVDRDRFVETLVELLTTNISADTVCGAKVRLMTKTSSRALSRFINVKPTDFSDIKPDSRISEIIDIVTAVIKRS